MIYLNFSIGDRVWYCIKLITSSGNTTKIGPTTILDISHGPVGYICEGFSSKSILFDSDLFPTKKGALEKQKVAIVKELNETSDYLDNLREEYNKNRMMIEKKFAAINEDFRNIVEMIDKITD